MNADLEARLRGDLPRLAEKLIDASPVAPSLSLHTPRRRDPVLIALLAACLVVGVTLGIVALSTGREPAPRSTAAPAGKAATGRGAWQSLDPSPLGTRAGVHPVWTGHEVLVWGGNRGLLFLQDGAAYNPTTRSWRSLAPNQWAFPSTVSAWTGDHFVVLAKNGGATYDPAANTWQDLPSLPEESNGSFVGITWTGHDILGLVQSQGDAIAVARYDPTTSSWTVGPREPATLPTSRARISVAWTGTQLVAWNGSDQGWAYTPKTREWRRLPAIASADSGATSSLTEVDGSLIVASTPATGSNRLVVAQLVGEHWQTITTVATRNHQPALVAAGHDVVIIDRSGKATPIEITVGNGKQTTLAGYPLDPGTDTAAVWTDNGLFVWGGDQTSRTSSRTDAALYTTKK
jgi:hypothetical protein